METVKAFLKLLWIIFVKIILAPFGAIVVLIRFAETILRILQSTLNHLIKMIEKEALLK